MQSQQLISPDKLAIVRLTRDESWVQLALWLTHEFTGGDLARFAHDATISVEGTDELSSSYNPANWMSAVTSGALYAFRNLRIPRQRLVIIELSGRLRASDMDTVANASAIAIAQLVDKELPSLPTMDWTIQARIAARRPSPSSQVIQDIAAERPLAEGAADRPLEDDGKRDGQNIPAELGAVAARPHDGR